MKYPSLLVALLLVGVAVSRSGAAAETTHIRCGKTDFGVFNSPIKESPFFVLSLSGPGGLRFYPFLVTRDFLEVRCETTAEGSEVFLLNHVCGGSGCRDNYGIIDTETGRFLLEPGDGFRGNDDEAARVLGHPVQPFTCTKKHSDTSQADEGANGEYCFHTPLELA